MTTATMPAPAIDTGRAVIDTRRATIESARTFVPAPSMRVPTRQRDGWQARADVALTGWSTH